MSYLTFERLKTDSKVQDVTFSKAITLNEQFSKGGIVGKRIFLSYRRKDVSYVKPIVKLLMDQGSSVYIDYLDETLPNPPDHTTAAILRSRLMKCGKFILLATPNSKDSQWMPWELGLGDGFTGYENTLIFPLLDNKDSWTEREYYRVYGYIKEGNEVLNIENKDWAVFYPDGKAIWLKHWLNS